MEGGIDRSRIHRHCTVLGFRRYYSEGVLPRHRQHAVHPVGLCAWWESFLSWYIPGRVPFNLRSERQPDVRSLHVGHPLSPRSRKITHSPFARDVHVLPIVGFIVGGGFPPGRLPWVHDVCGIRVLVDHAHDHGGDGRPGASCSSNKLILVAADAYPALSNPCSRGPQATQQQHRSSQLTGSLDKE